MADVPVLVDFDEFCKDTVQMRCSNCGDVYRHVKPNEEKRSSVMRKDTLEMFDLAWNDCGHCAAFHGLRGTLEPIN